MEHPSIVPTEINKSKEAKRYKGKNPYGLISKEELDWVKGDRELLGEGSYGSVYKYTSSPYGTVAVKFMAHNEEIQTSIIREISMLVAINHPNVIDILDVFFDSESIAIVLPLGTTTLDKVVNRKGIPATLTVRERPGLTEDLLDSIIYQIIRGMIAIQDHNILNGDYKPPNILVFNTENCVQIKIADFGLAQLDKCYDVTAENRVFTLWYRPPELLTNRLGPTRYSIAKTEYNNLKERDDLVKRYKGAKNPTKYGNPTLDNPKRGIPLDEDEEELYRRLEGYLERNKDEPDTNKQHLYTRKADSWALGCIIFELISRNPLFSYKKERENLELIFSRLGFPEDEDIKDTPYYNSLEGIRFEKKYKAALEENEKKTGRKVLPAGYARTLGVYLSDEDVIPRVYQKYIPIILDLVRFRPQDRADIRKIANNPIFNHVLDSTLKCLQYEKVRDVTLTDVCLEYLHKYQYPLAKINIFTNIKYRYLLYDWILESCNELRLNTRIASIASAILEIFADKELRESRQVETESLWNTNTFQLYAMSALQLASSFDTNEEITIDDLIYISDNSYTRDQIFRGSLMIFASIDFNMVRSTAYDVFYEYSKQFSKLVREVGLILIRISFMTILYQTYSHATIGLAIILLSGTICNEEKEISYPELDSVFECIDNFMDELILILKYYKSNMQLDRRRETHFDLIFRTNNLKPTDVVSAIRKVAITEGLGLVYKPLVSDIEELAKQMSKTSI